MAQKIQFGTEGDDLIQVGNAFLTYVGLAGNDTYALAGAPGGAVLVEQAGGGVDTVVLNDSVTFVLPDFIENLILGGFAGTATGNSLDNRLVGNDTGNTFVGGGGTDTMVGGNGDDTYFVDSASDRIEEGVGGSSGTDLVDTRVSYVLPVNVEIAQVNVGVTDTRVDITGNAADNIITGSAAANLLSGLDGADSILAGDGNDTVLGGNGNDDLGGEGGNDLVDGGAGDDTVRGGTGNDTVLGGAGNDELRGGTGINTLTGGAGNDTYVVTLATLGLDTIIEAAGGGIDTLVSDAITTLPANVENLTFYAFEGGFTLTGNALNNRIIAGLDAARNVNDLIDGLAGNDWIDGREGADTMRGGTGDDVMVVDNVGDVVVEKPNEGTDLVYTSAVDTTLADNVENLTLLAGTAARFGRGNALANVITGNTADNYLTGGAGNDRLISGGGADSLFGGAGDDTYVIADPAASSVVLVRVFENSDADSGKDTIRIDQVADFYQLPDNVERLIAPLVTRVTGNRSDNFIDAQSDGNVIDGGAGADTMVGGAGNNYYRVDSAGDVVVELANGGAFDSIETTVSYTLSANVESMFLRAGAGNLNGTGNALDNTIGGNAGNNTLIGLGGNDQLLGDRGNDSLVGGAGNDTLQGDAGNDTMQGDGGDDVYYVDTVNDVVVERANEGIDSINTAISLSLDTQPYANVESATLVFGSRGVNLTGSAAANVLTGNERDNVLTGLDGNDTLDGGGFGRDTLIGGRGDDVYIVDNLSDPTSPDTLTENSNEGNDTVLSLGSWTLADNFENLLLNPNTPGAADAIGNGANNRLGGTGQNNLLDGQAGNDTMTGGGGNDTYVVDAVGDVVVETVNGGNDLVRLSSAAAAASYLLPVNVENATLTASAAGRITGNVLANTIDGNSQNDTIDGGAGDDTISGNGGDDVLTGGLGDDSIGGGSGNDLMTGGAGDDTYGLDSGDGALNGVSTLEDRVVEAAGGGIDTIVLDVAGAGFGLPDQVENLILTASVPFGASYAVLGNALANRVQLQSVTGANVDVGAGDDTVLLGDVFGSALLTLRGGQGEDSLSFSTESSGGFIDMSGFETARINADANATFSGGSVINGLRELAVTGSGDLSLPGSLATRDVLDGYGGTLSLAVADITPGIDTLNLRIVDSTGASIGGMGDVERVVIDSATTQGNVTNLLTVFPLVADPDRVFVVGGAAPLLLAGLPDAGKIQLSGYTSNAFDFTMDDSAGVDHLTIGVDGFVGTIGADFGAGQDELTLSSGSPGASAPSDVSLTGLATDDRLVLTGAGSLTLNDVVVQNVVIQNYTGNLVYGASAFGSPVTFSAAAAGQGSLSIVGTIGSDVFTMGNTLDGSDSISGQAGSDTLTANITGLVAGTTGRLQFNGVENSTFTVNAGSNTTSLDMDSVVGGGLNPIAFAVNGGTALQSVLDVQNASGTWSFSGFNGVLTFSSRGDAAAIVTGTGGNDAFTGHDAADSFSGGAGNDTLSGGLGNDTLTGGANDDVFVLGDQSTFFGDLGAPDIDTITDFGATDTLQLKGDSFDSLFSALPNGVLAPGAFRSGAGATTAADADDRIIYNTTNGNLYYDADGNAGGFAAIQIATLTGAPGTLTAADIVVT